MEQKIKFLFISISLLVFVLLIFWQANSIDSHTSSNKYCVSCHVHTYADNEWKKSSHFNNSHGIEVKCVACHLPPKDASNYWEAKIIHGVNDLHAYYFTDLEKINWAEKRELDYAQNIIPKSSCISCHQNLFPFKLSEKGGQAHLYYEQNKDALHCINCHKGVGHGESMTHDSFHKYSSIDITNDTIYAKSYTITEFVSFTETIPNTDQSIEIIAVYGNSEHEVDSFFIAKYELSWDVYLLFLRETESEGRTNINSNNIDAISGATPPWGDPSQGWGMGIRPAITMTWKAASVFCKWLSLRTGKTYRLPSEKEWSYACKGGVSIDATVQNELIYKDNSGYKSATPSDLRSNSLGIVDMLGNVKEFCSDEVSNGERIIKGGSFRSKLEDVSAKKIEYTQHDNWLKTDPQMPKSIWWYSDCKDVGIRIVCNWK